ncbi:uncharacterized protein LOC129316434 [Prosopis cineraria]|uniref:uncharacterized protein LOC129316434 n=1 Tax=Prosopis cineraria TaxID=364024 RepID=UPI00241059EF|nr:uncharacterized protein LOC129316434 [Prosopis cineraria]
MGRVEKEEHDDVAMFDAKDVKTGALVSTTSFCSHPLTNSSCKTGAVSTIPTISLPASSVKFSKISIRGFSNKNCVSLRHGRFQAKSSSAEVETSELTTSISGNNGPSTSFLSLLRPLLKLLSGGDPSQQRNFAFEVATSSLASLARFAWGSKSVVDSSVNKEIASNFPMHLQLYEFDDIVKYLFEGCGEGRSPSTGLLESMQELCVRHYVNWSSLTFFKMWEMDLARRTYFLLLQDLKRGGCGIEPQRCALCQTLGNSIIGKVVLPVYPILNKLYSEGLTVRRGRASSNLQKYMGYFFKL